jgi:hypothetical protein
MNDLLRLTLSSNERNEMIFLSLVGRGRGLSRSDGKVRGSRSHRTVYSSGFIVAWIVSSTPSKLVKTSLVPLILPRFAWAPPSPRWGEEKYAMATS